MFCLVHGSLSVSADKAMVTRHGAAALGVMGLWKLTGFNMLQPYYLHSGTSIFLYMMALDNIWNLVDFHWTPIIGYQPVGGRSSTTFSTGFPLGSGALQGLWPIAIRSTSRIRTRRRYRLRRVRRWLLWAVLGWCILVLDPFRYFLDVVFCLFFALLSTYSIFTRS